MHAHDLTLEFHNRDVHEEPLVPFGPRVDIPYLQRQFPLDHGLQLLDQYVAKMASLAAVDRNRVHSTACRSDPCGHDRGKGTQTLVILQAQSSNQHASTRAGERCERSTEVPGAGQPGAASAQHCPKQWQAVDQGRGTQQVVRSQLYDYVISFIEREMPRDQRIDPAWPLVTAKEPCSAAFARGATCATDRRRHLNDDVRWRVVQMNGQNSTFGLIHGRSLPQWCLAAAHRRGDLLDRDGGDFTNSGYPVTIDACAV